MGSRQETTVCRRENHSRDFRRADFGLRLRAGLATLNRVWDFSLFPNHGSVISRVRIRTAIESVHAQDDSDELSDLLRTGSKCEIGVTNRIRTGTNAFTGRDAAVTS